MNIISRSSETVTLTSKTPGEWTTLDISQTNGGGSFDPLGITTTNGTGFIDGSSVSDNYYVGMWHQHGRIPTGSQGINWWSMAALSSAAILPLVIVAIFLEKYIIKGMAAGAVK